MSQPRFNPNTGQWEFPGNGPPQPGNAPNGRPTPRSRNTGHSASPHGHDRTDSVDPRQPRRQITMSERGSSPGPPPPRDRSQPTRPASSGKPRRWPWVTGIAAAFIVGTLTGSAGGGTDTSTTTASGPAPVSAAAPSPTAPVDPPAESPTPAPEPELFTSGTYVVGEDIAPGRYKTAGPDGTGFGMPCYWERSKNTEGTIDSVIANEIVQGQSRVTVKGSDGAVKFTGSCEWTPA